MSANRQVIGLDIGATVVRAVWAERRGRRVVVRRRETLRPPVDGPSRAEVIAHWAEKHNLARTPCVVGLPGRHAIFQPFHLTPDDPRSIEQAAEMEVLAFNEMASETMRHDFSSFTLADGDKRALLAMARPSVVDEWLALTHRMGLQLMDLVPTPAACFEGLAAAANPPEPEVRLVVNIGHAGTEVSIGGDRGLLFARAMAAGGQWFTEALARERDLPYTQAELLKQTEGRLDGEGPVAAALQRAAEMWMTEMDAILSVFRSLFPDDTVTISRAVLCGGGSRLGGLADYLATRLHMPVTLAAAGNDPDETVALGLASLGLRATTEHLSLLPQAIRNELMFRRQKPFWITAATAAALTLAISLVGGYRDIRRKEAQLKLQRQSLRYRQQLVSQIESVKTRGEHLRAMAEPLRPMLANASLLVDLTALVARTLADEDRITLICDATSYYEETQKKPSEAPPRRTARQPRQRPEPAEPQPPSDTVIIEGYTATPNLSSVRDLIQNLEAAAFVASADLLGDDATVARTGRGPGGRDKAWPFAIEVKLNLLDE